VDGGCACATPWSRIEEIWQSTATKVITKLSKRCWCATKAVRDICCRRHLHELSAQSSMLPLVQQKSDKILLRHLMDPCVNRCLAIRFIKIESAYVSVISHCSCITMRKTWFDETDMRQCRLYNNIYMLTIGAWVEKLLAKLGLTPQKAPTRCYKRDPAAMETSKRDTYPSIANGETAWCEDLFLRTRRLSWRRSTGNDMQRQRGNAGFAVLARDSRSRRCLLLMPKPGFWFTTHQRTISAELFLVAFKTLMRLDTSSSLLLDNLPVQCARILSDYVASTCENCDSSFDPATHQN
jgi:hypothetical protein